MSLTKKGRSVSEKASSVGDRARDVAGRTVPQARRARTTAVHGVKHGVEGARGWAAPRLDSAADALSATVAPKVSSALHTAAKTVQPSQARKTGIRRLFSWRWIAGIVAAAGAAGAAAAISMKRYKSATANAKDTADALADETGDPPSTMDEPSRQQVNGRITAS